MTKIKLYALCLVATVAMFSCSKYDDTELRNDVNDLKSRVEKLEAWCKTTNGQITALQGIVSALEAKDFVTGVTPIMEGTKEVGYTITFSKGNPITIMHGKDGAQGATGVTPVIGVKQDTDGNYYWTKKVGDADATWMTDENGNKIRTTGDKGVVGPAPVLSVATFEGRLYWQIDGKWLLNGSNKVPATGDNGAQGDAIFAADGIDYTTDTENVIFTLADGITKITLPKSSAISIGFDSYDTFYCSETNNQITIVLPTTLKETDYNAIAATISTANGTDMDIQTRAASTGTWRVEVIKPAFAADGTLVAGSAQVKLTLPQDKTNYKALLKVTLIDSKGKEHSVSRVVWGVDGTVINNTTGSLSDKIVDAANIKQLSIIGSVSFDDFQFIRENLTAMEVLDLSRTTITSLPIRAMAFYSSMGLTNNTTLKTVILPDGLTTINDSAFAMCENLQEINIPKSVHTLGRWMFEGCNALEEITIPANVTKIPASAFYGAGIRRVTIPETIENVGAYAFSDCKKLETANIPSSVTEISEGMFYQCSELKQVTWHDNITSIGDDAFTICQKLFSNKHVVIPSKVTYIGMRAFSWTGMNSVKLPEGVETIKNSAFSECPIKTIDLPSTITSLHAIAFHWQSATTVICRSTAAPEMPLVNDSGNSYPMFYLINQACVLKRPASSNYSAWNSYFKGGVQDL